ncbi:ATP-dependent RNA helicase DbpA [Teredinibacter purpureus]|uniref:ATP-dependent RNA helicase DbpA n=1 Tax=Teredinibacter purpureus TaxID=2731756 RepID=UPI001F48CA7B
MSKPTLSKSSFGELSLDSALLRNLEDLGYQQMTDIQAAALPPIIEGADVIGKAKTGSGKTAAFGLGILNKLKVERFRVQTLVLCPTRELADQVARELRKLARAVHNIKILTLCGGMPFGPQVGSLEHGAHIVVGTPGRVEEHVRKGKLLLQHVDTLVLDEADRMLDMGFQASLDAIIEHVPAGRQTLLFSATFPSGIKSLAARVQRDPLMVEVAATHSTLSIQQHFYRVDDNAQRLQAVCQVLQHFNAESTVIFCNTKRETDEVAVYLKDQGFTALGLHGDMQQKDRDRTLVCFANRSVSVLVATDVAARGLDIEKLDMVINYHLSRDPEVHVHRIGRTGRAGESGKAVSLISEKERYKIERLEGLLGQPIEAEPLPLPDESFVPQKPPMVTIQIDGGKKQKVRPGDIVGALTGEGGIDGTQVGKIHIFDLCAYVAVMREASRAGLKKLSNGKLKGRAYRVRVIGV